MQKYVDIVFVQDWDAEREEQAAEGNPIPEWGDWAAIAEYLTQWDYGDETDGAHTVESADDAMPWGPYDDTLEILLNGLYYVLSWNTRLRYVGLVRRPLADWNHPFWWEAD